jgi:hypothetical protein
MSSSNGDEPARCPCAGAPRRSAGTVSPWNLVGTTSAVPSLARSLLQAWCCSTVHPRGGTARSTARVEQQVERRVGVDGVGERPGGGRAVHRIAVGLGAVRGEREPQRQPAGAARQVVGVVARVPVVRGRRRRGSRRAGCAWRRDRRVAIHERGTVVRGEQPLVRVDAEAVGVLDAGERRRPSGAQRGQRRRRRRRAATGRGRRTRRRSRRVRRSRRRWWCRPWRRRRTRRARDCSSSSERSTSACAGHPVALVAAHRHHVDVHHPGRGADLACTSVGGGERVAAGPAAAAVEVALRAATSALRLAAEPPDTKTPPAVSGKPASVRQPAQHLVLGGDGTRTGLPVAAEDRRRADHEVEHRGGHRGRRGHVRQVHRVVHRPTRRDQHLAEHPHRLVAAQPTPLGGDDVLRTRSRSTPAGWAPHRGSFGSRSRSIA